MAYRKAPAKKEREWLRGEEDKIKLICLNFDRRQVVRL